jgi:hypothetical protein
MKKQGTFGNADLAKKIASQFGSPQDVMEAKMQYTSVVQTFIRKIDEAHQRAAKSKLKFG